MDSDLVGAPGLEPALDQRGVTQGFEPGPVGDRALAAPGETIAIFLRLVEERASGASTLPFGKRGMPLTIAR